MADERMIRKDQDASKGLIQKAELLESNSFHKEQDGVKSERAQKAEQDRVAEMERELADDNRSFGTDHSQESRPEPAPKASEKK